MAIKYIINKKKGILPASLRVSLCLIFSGLLITPLYAQFPLYNAQLAAIGSPYTYSICLLPPSLPGAQKIAVEKRYIVATLDMGDNYTLGSAFGGTVWAATLHGDLVAQNALNNDIATYKIKFRLSQSTPEKKIYVDYTPVWQQAHHFVFRPTAFSNAVLAAKNVIRMSLATEDKIKYDITTNAGASMASPWISSVTGLTNLDNEVVQAKFEWKLIGGHYNSYDLEILKAEPFLNSLVLDWTKAEHIEVTGGNNICQSDQVTDYTVTLAEGKGYYFWRVRGIGNYYDVDRTNTLNIGNWAGDQSYNFNALFTTTSTTPDWVIPVPPSSWNIMTIPLHFINYNGSTTGIFFYYEQFDNDRNWSYGKVLSEGSRAAETMTYASSLNQLKQVQTRLFSPSPLTGIGEIVGKQTVYDYSGRPSLNSLPAPIGDPQFDYKELLLRNAGNQPFNAADFDDGTSLAGGGTIFINNPLAATSVIGTVNNYYSAAYSNANDEHKDFTPDANGMPYTRTLFYNDATGRVFRQGGVGTITRLTPGISGFKNTCTLYGSVAQVELDRVFGNEAPLAASTYKTVNIDPNNVQTTSYIAKAGQLLATALTNSKTTQLDLESATGLTTPPTFSATYTLDPGVITGGDLYSETSKTILIQVENPLQACSGNCTSVPMKSVDYDYSITPSSFSSICAPPPICWTCDYKVEITVSCPAFPDDVTRNIRIIADISPTDLAPTCAFTPAEVIPSFIVDPTYPITPDCNFDNMTTTNQFCLPEGTYVISKKVYSYNENSLTGETYLQERREDLIAAAQAWTAAQNCCGPIVIPTDNFNCDPTLDCSVLANRNQIISKLEYYIAMEHTAENPASGTLDYYYDHLINPTGEAHITSGQILFPSYPQGFYNNASQTIVAGAADDLLTQLEAAGFDCNAVYQCILSVGAYLTLNINYAFLPAGTQSSFYNEFDFLQSFFSCMGYVPDDPCSIVDNVKIYNQLPTGTTYSANDLVIWYMDHDGSISTSNVTVPPSLTGITLIEIFSPENVGNVVPVAEDCYSCPGANNELVTKVTMNTACYQGYNETSVMALAISDPVERAKWSAQHICQCHSTSNSNVEFPGQDQGDGFNEIVQVCEDRCESKRASFEQAIDNYVFEVNANRAPPVLLTSDPTWWGFDQVFINNAPACDGVVSKTCLINIMVENCLSKCQMPLTAAINSFVDTESQPGGCMDPLLQPQNYGTSPCTPYTAPFGLGNWASFDAFVNDVNTKAILEHEQNEFTKAFSMTAKFAPPSVPDNCAPLPYPPPQYSEAGDPQDVVEMMNDTLNYAFGRMLNEKRITGDFGLGVPAQVSFASTAWASSPDIKYSQRIYYFKAKNTSGGFYNIDLILNIIWDVSPTSSTSNHMLEMNFAFYCNGSPSASDYWAYIPDYSAFPCDLFSQFSNSYTYTLDKLVNITVDKEGIFHVFLINKGCGDDAATVLTPGNTSICRSRFRGEAQMEIISASPPPALLYNIEVDDGNNNSTYLMGMPVNFTSGSTALDIAGSVSGNITATQSDPHFNATNIDPVTGNSSVFVHINVPLSYEGAVSGLTGTVTADPGFLYDLNPGAVNQFTFTTCGTPLMDKFSSCTAVTDAENKVCPYAYEDVVGFEKTYTDNPVPPQIALTQLPADLINFWNGALERGIINRTVSVPSSPLHTIAFTNVNYPPSQYSYYEEIFPFSYRDITNTIRTYDAVATVVRENNSGIMLAAQISIWDKCGRDATDPAIFVFGLNDNNLTSTSSILPAYDVPNQVPIPGILSSILKIYFHPTNPVTGTGAIALNFAIDVNANLATNADLYGGFAFGRFSNFVSNPSWNPFSIGNPQVIAPNNDFFTHLLSSHECRVVCEACMLWYQPELPVEDILFHPLSCEEQMQIYVQTQTLALLEECLQQQLEALEETYRLNCLENIDDDMSVTFDMASDNYTLYYYDRAKNLIHTVPPDGVDIITSTTDLAQIVAHRTNSAILPIYPAHNLVTDYEYNSAKQLIQQETPDGGITRFWYNAFGQLVLSQDAQQAATIDPGTNPNGLFSYSRYDALGRVVEVGELTGFIPSYNSTSLNQIIEVLWTNPHFPYTDATLSAFVLNASSPVIITAHEVVRTFYTDPQTGITLNGESQQNLRNRISKTWRDVNGDNIFSYSDDVASYYSYDPHGNVQWLIHEIPGIGKKTIRYEYDLVSGNINKVYYNEKTKEQFIHKYEYDADNRILSTFTSTDEICWDKDAGYEYYLHGPLARTEVGEDRIQGTDYVYTAEGYLKSINQAQLDPASDPGHDGHTTNDFLKDEFAMELGYYDGDYIRAGTFIGSDNPVYNSPLTNIDILFGTVNTSGGFTTRDKELFNGNIGYWMFNTRKGATASGINQNSLKAYSYRYDKLNRLKNADFKGYGTIGGAVWSENSNGTDYTSTFPSGVYDEQFSYDPNGNIKEVLRNSYGVSPTALAMDEIRYDYLAANYNGAGDAIGRRLDNRLYHYTDNKPPTSFNDLPPLTGFKFPPTYNVKTDNNYLYDNEGKLISDVKEGLTITWNTLNKVAGIEKRNGAGSLIYTMNFRYDASGNRVIKEIEYPQQTDPDNSNTTYYVYDAGGKVMAIYTKKHDPDFVAPYIYTLEELPIYGSSRLGEYRPMLKVGGFSTPFSDEGGAPQPSSGSEDSKILVPSSDGVFVADFYFPNFIQNNFNSFAGAGNAVNNPAVVLDQDDHIVLSAYFNQATNIWTVTDGLGSTTGIISGGSSDKNAAPVFIKNPATGNYYFFYAAANSLGFQELYYADIDPIGNVMSTGNQLLPANNPTFGRKITPVTYSDGNSRLFVYGASAGDLHYLIYSIDITSNGIGVPQVRATINNSSTNPISPFNDIAISPAEDRLAMTLLGAGLQGDVVFYDLSIGTGQLNNPFYKTLGAGIGNIEFTYSGKFMYYGPVSGQLSRYHLAADNIESFTYAMGSGNSSFRRATGDHVLLLRDNASSLTYVQHAENTDPAYVNISGMSLPSGLSNQELSQNTIKTEKEIQIDIALVRKTLNHWIAGTLPSASPTSGAVMVNFDPVTGVPAVSNSFIGDYNGLVAHNVTVAENEAGACVFKFFATGSTTFTSYLLDENDWPGFIGPGNGLTYLDIKAEAGTKSIAVKAPENNYLYYLITGHQGQFYYHIIDVGTVPGTLVSINHPIEIFNSGGTPLTYDPQLNQYALAAYNDTRTEAPNKLYIAVNTSRTVDLYECPITRLIGIGEATIAHTFIDEYCITIPWGLLCFNMDIFGRATLDLGEMQISYDGNAAPVNPDRLVLGMKVTHGIGDGVNMTHRIEEFAMNPLASVTATYQGSRWLQQVARPAVATIYDFRAWVEKNTITFDYANDYNHLFYVEQYSNASVVLPTKKSCKLRRIELIPGVITDVDFYNVQPLMFETEIRRAVGDNITVDDRIYVNVKNLLITPANPSKLYAYSTPAGSTASVLVNTLLLGSGPSNFGLPLQPYRIYNSQIEFNYMQAYRNVGKKLYELTDHLGNVRATLHDYRLWADANTNNVVNVGENYTYVNSFNDYYSFGMQMPGRAFNAPDYRYGFNGKEKDDELKGGGNSYDYGARMYDSRLGRWFSNDAYELRYPEWSTYNYSLDNPIKFVDPSGKGAEVTKITENGKSHYTIKARIYLYTKDNCLKDENGVPSKIYADQIKESIEKSWNHPVDPTTGQQIDLKNVTFEVEILPVSETAAQEAFNTTIADQDHPISMNNFVELTDVGIGSSNSGFEGNTGTFDVSQNYNQANTTYPHEFGHLLNWYLYQESQNSVSPPDYGHEWFDAVPSTVPIMAQPNQTEMGLDFTKRTVTTTDLTRIGGGQGGVSNQSFRGKEGYRDGNKRVQKGYMGQKNSKSMDGGNTDTAH